MSKMQMVRDLVRHEQCDQLFRLSLPGTSTSSSNTIHFVAVDTSHLCLHGGCFCPINFSHVEFPLLRAYVIFESARNNQLWIGCNKRLKECDYVNTSSNNVPCTHVWLGTIWREEEWDLEFRRPL